MSCRNAGHNTRPVTDSAQLRTSHYNLLGSSREGITNSPCNSGSGVSNALHDCGGSVAHGSGCLLNNMTGASNHTGGGLANAPGDLRGAVTDAASYRCGSVTNALGNVGDAMADAPCGLGDHVSDALPDISDTFTDLCEG